MQGLTGVPDVVPSPIPFGVLVPGQPIITTLEQVDPVRWTVPVVFADTRYFTVFLTMPGSLPPGFGVGVYLCAPPLPHPQTTSLGVALPPVEESGFQYVGCLWPDRPSELFTVPVTLLSGAATPMVLGLSLESVGALRNLEQQPASSQRLSTATRVALAEKVLEEFYQFASSYAKLLRPHFFDTPGCGAAAGLTPEMLAERESFLASLSEAEEFVVMPINFVNKWRERLERRIQRDKSFVNSF